MQCDVCGRSYFASDELRRQGDRTICTTCVQQGAGEREPDPVVRGRFRKMRVPPIRRAGQYRGSGSIVVDDEGLIVSGCHVLSMGARWGIALALFFGSLILSTLVTRGSMYLAPGLIPLYLLMEYGWLKREEATRIRWKDVKQFATDPKRELVAVEYDALTNWESPIVMKTPLWRDLATVLAEKTPEANAVIHPRALSPGRAAWVSSWIFIGWYLLFALIVGWTMAGIFAWTGIGGIPAIRNVAGRVAVFVLLFGVPLAGAFLLARRSYRKRIAVPAAPAPEPIPAGALQRLQSAARGTDDIPELLVQFPGYGAAEADSAVLAEQLDKRCAGDPAAVKRLLAIAVEGDPALDRHTTGEGEAWWWRAHAIDTLGRLRTTEAIDPLLGLLRQSSRIAQFYDVLQPAAARALGAIGDARAVAPLREILAGDTVWAPGRRAVIAAIEKLEGAKVVTPEAQLTAAEALCGTSRWEEALAILDPLTESAQGVLSEQKLYYAWFLRGQCLKAKGDIDAAAASYRRALESHRGSFDLALAWAHLREIGALGRAESAPLLLRALDDEHWQTRAEAARLLGELGDPAAVPSLEAASRGVTDVRMLLDHGQRQRFAIAYPGGRIPPAEAESLRQFLADRNTEVVDAAREAIDRIRKKVPAL